MRFSDDRVMRKLEEMDSRLRAMEVRLDGIGGETGRMVGHIDFIEKVYCTVRKGLSCISIMPSLPSLPSAGKQHLPAPPRPPSPPGDA